MNTDPIFSDQEFDEELRELLKTQNQEKVSARFTANVMDQIKDEELSIKYTPVISARTMLVIVFFIGILAVWAILQPGSSSDGVWSLPAFSASHYYDLLINWQQIFFTFSFKWLSSSAVFLPLGGLLLALGVHYIFLAMLKNRTIKKVEHLYCF
ncbi:MAG: hypothetical protein DRI89_04455 [Bacteroidetes bacterium]|nr:MAG: hypothetical protein DRI89_04455 [Bacteroidota bacterium]